MQRHLICQFASLFISRALGNAIPFYKTMSEGCAAAFRIFELINRDPPIDANDMNGQTLERVEGNLELRNVDFAYPTRPNLLVLQRFCIRIPAGTSSPTTHCELQAQAVKTGAHESLPHSCQSVHNSRSGS